MTTALDTTSGDGTVSYRLGHIAALRHNGEMIDTGDVLDIEVTSEGSVHQPHVAVVGGDVHRRSAWVKRVVDALAESNDTDAVRFAFIDRGTRNSHGAGHAAHTAGTFELWRDQVMPTGRATERAQMVTWLVRVLNGRADVLAQTRQDTGADYATIAERNYAGGHGGSPAIFVVVDSGDSVHGLEIPEHVQLGNYYADISEDDVYAKIHRHGAALGVFLIRTLPDTTAYKARALGYDVVIDLDDTVDAAPTPIAWITGDDGREFAEYLLDTDAAAEPVADTATATATEPATDTSTDTAGTAQTPDTQDEQTPAADEQRGQED